MWEKTFNLTRGSYIAQRIRSLRSSTVTRSAAISTVNSAGPSTRIKTTRSWALSAWTYRTSLLSWKGRTPKRRKRFRVKSTATSHQSSHSSQSTMILWMRCGANCSQRSISYAAKCRHLREKCARWHKDLNNTVWLSSITRKRSSKGRSVIWRVAWNPSHCTYPRPESSVRICQKLSFKSNLSWGSVFNR